MANFTASESVPSSLHVHPFGYCTLDYGLQQSIPPSQQTKGTNPTKSTPKISAALMIYLSIKVKKPEK